MSLKYRDKNGAEVVLAGLTPGGNIEAGAVATREGTFSFDAEVPNNATGTKTVVFSEAMPDADYEVIIEPKSQIGPSYGGAQIGVPEATKTASGFDVIIYNQTGSSIGTASVWSYKAFKLYEVADAEQLYSTVQDLEAMVPANASSTNKFTTADDLRIETRALDRRLDDVEDVVPSSASITNKLVTQSDLSGVEIDKVEDINDVELTNIQDGQTLIWDDTNSKWVNGQGGKIYTAGDGINISNTDEISAKVDDTSITTDTNDALKVADTYKTIFVGTRAQWNALSTADKVKYNEAHITDDVIGGEVADEVTNGLMSPVTSNAVYDYPIDSIADGQHRPPTSNAVYDALALKQGIIKSKTIQNATTEQYYNALSLGLTSTQIPVAVKATNGNIIAFLMTCASTWYLAVYENKTDGYKTPVYNTNIGTLTVYYFEI